MKVYETVGLHFQAIPVVGPKVQCTLSEDEDKTHLCILIDYDETLTPKGVLKLNDEDTTYSMTVGEDIPLAFHMDGVKYTLRYFVRMMIHQYLCQKKDNPSNEKDLSHT